MEENKRKAICEIVDRNIREFADEKLFNVFAQEVNDPLGVINSKKNNCFIAELGEEFMFYSAFVRSFDSKFGNVFEKMGNELAELTYEVRDEIDSYLLPDQVSRISSMIDKYLDHTEPKVNDYKSFVAMSPRNIESYRRKHATDNYFYDKENKTHYLIELKASGDLDNKKARSEKEALLEEYFLVRNIASDDEKVVIYFATAYNKFGEENEWKQERVKQFFAEDELLIGKDYWNFVCGEEDGFDVVFQQYKESAKYIKQTLDKIKNLYF